MKEYIYTILLLAFMAKMGSAQSPVITEENVYLTGDQINIAWCDNPTDPGDAGINVIWDFSDLNEVEELIFEYVDPQMTPFDDQFPNATLCGIGSDNYHSFYSLSNGFLNVEGYAGFVEGASDTLKIIHTDTEAYIPIPFEYGDTHTDVFSGTSEILGFTATINGSVSFEADGYGTLILPNGTHENAIRYKLNRTQDNTILGQTSTTSKEQWGWMSPDHRFWLCLMETNNDGFGEEDIVWYAKNPLTLSTQQMAVNPMKVYPNPFRSGQELFFESEFEGMATIAYFTPDGKIVGSSNQFISFGPNRLLHSDRLAKGVYMLCIQSGEQRLVAKIAVE